MLALLGDSLPYSLEGLLGLRAHFNHSVWPAPLIIFAVLPAILPLHGAGHASARFMPPWILAVCWLFCGLVTQHRFIAMLDWSAVYSGWLCVLQAALLVAASLWKPGRPHVQKPTSKASGLLLMAAAWLLLPLLQWLWGTPPESIMLVGSDPGATALFTAGWLILHGGRWWLWPLPLAWILIEFAIGLGLGYIPAMTALPLTVAAGILHLRARKKAAAPGCP